MASYPCRRSNLEMRVVGDEVILLDVGNGLVHRLNATAGKIWEYCDGRTPLAEIASRLAAAYGIQAREVAPDVENAISELTRLGLLIDAE